jgi:hypothetical protein
MFSVISSSTGIDEEDRIVDRNDSALENLLNDGYDGYDGYDGVYSSYFLQISTFFDHFFYL